MDTIALVQQALAEDTPTTDITSDLLIPTDAHGNATMYSKSPGVFFAGPIVAALATIHNELTINNQVEDGAIIQPNTPCLTISGPINHILGVERVLLNFIQRLSGISTTTRDYVTALNDTTIGIYDTRKTTPLLRHLEKQAVVAGGGKNHRFSLSDMMLIKENHLAHYIKNNDFQTLNNKLAAFKSECPTIQIEIEIDRIELLQSIDIASCDILLFDNMNLDQLQSCFNYLTQFSSQPLIEVSGNITLDTIHQYRGLPIDRISVGSLTHSVKALDVSLLIE